jgi:ESS family glutamate:Na+ symporter
MDFSWSIFIDLGLVSFALLLATFLRSKIRFFQRYIIPNALTAGFILLPFYNFIAPKLGLSSEGLGNLVFHLLNLSFISMSLRGTATKDDEGGGRRILSSSVMILIQYSLQLIVGFGLTLLIMFTFMPDIFPSFGILMPLGFGLGPGQAYAIGKTWESLGFANAGNLGLTFAAFGYIWACFVGITLINRARIRGRIENATKQSISDSRARKGLLARDEEKPAGSRLTTQTDAIDTMSYSAAAILLVYVITYLLLRLITYALSFVGPSGEQLAKNLWGIAFIFGAMIALLVKKFLRSVKIEYTIDDGSLTRITGICVDVMVTAAIAAIALVVITRFWIPILIIGIAGGIVTTMTILYTSSRLFDKNRFCYAIMFYGCLTGTLSTGLALLRVIDPDFKTPVARDYMYGAGITFFACIPLILSLNLPGYWHTSGKPLYLYLTIAVLGFYLLVSIVGFIILAGKRAFRTAGSLWLDR